MIQRVKEVRRGLALSAILLIDGRMAASLRDITARRRMELSPITTSLAVQQPYPSQTPISAISSNSLSAPFGHHPVPYTPASAVRQYNPQQWTPSPSVATENRNHFAARQETEGTLIFISHFCISEALMSHTRTMSNDRRATIRETNGIS